MKTIDPRPDSACRGPIARQGTRGPRGGFTLLEVMVALTVLGVVVMFVYQVLQNSVRGQDMVREGLRAPKIQNAILGQILKDFRYLYWDGFSGDTGLVGKNHEVHGMDADVIDFVTARPSRAAQADEDALRDAPPSPITEVGYALRANDENSDYLELYRREDWFIDDNPVRGGKYTLLYNKITKFSLQYFDIPEQNVDGKPLDEWDTRVKKKLPYAVVLEISLDVDEPSENDRRDESQEHISRIILLKGAYNVARKPPAGQD